MKNVLRKKAGGTATIALLALGALSGNAVARTWDRCEVLIDGTQSLVGRQRSDKKWPGILRCGFIQDSVTTWARM